MELIWRLHEVNMIWSDSTCIGILNFIFINMYQHIFIYKFQFVFTNLFQQSYFQLKMF